MTWWCLERLKTSRRLCLTFTDVVESRIERWAKGDFLYPRRACVRTVLLSDHYYVEPTAGAYLLSALRKAI